MQHLAPARDFNRKIDSCQENLQVWDRNTFGHVRNSLKKKLADLKEAKEGGF